MNLELRSGLDPGPVRGKKHFDTRAGASELIRTVEFQESFVILLRNRV
jgi:hypothetical protein